MIFFLYGEDTFRSRAKKRELVEGFKQKRDATGMNVVVLDCTKTKEESVFEELQASPFLAEKRLVVLENLLNMKKNTLQGRFLDFIEQNKLPETTILVIWDEGKAFKSDAGKLFDILKKEKYAQEFSTLAGTELRNWILQEVQTRKTTVDPLAVQYLMNNAPKSTWALSSLLDQLSAFARGRCISKEDVQIFLSEASDDNIFNLVDAIISKDSKRVFQMIDAQYAKGEDAQFIFAMLLRQFRILLELADIDARGIFIPIDVLAKQTGLHPFVLKKSLPLAKKYSFAQLKKIYSELRDMDIKTKTGQGKQSLMIDFFVGKLCL